MKIARRSLPLAIFALGATIACHDKNERHSVTLTWNPPAGVAVASYNIYRGIPGTPFVKLANVPAPPYEDKIVNGGQTYRYAVTAIDKEGRESRFSDATEAKIP